MIGHNLALHEALCIPSFKYNLLLVNQFCNQQGDYVVFTPKCCMMQAPLMKRPQVLHELYAGLYLV